MANLVQMSYHDLSALLITVAYNWLDNHAAFTTDFITPQALDQMGRALQADAQTNLKQTALKKSNTIALKELNRRINDAVSVLRKSIQFEYKGQSDLSGHYLNYGLERVGKSNTFSMTKDNDLRTQKLEVVVRMLEEAGNPLADKSPGLAHFRDLQIEHNQHWGEAKNMRSKKAVLVLKAKTGYKEAYEILRKLLLNIRFVFPASTAKSVIRQFGFLPEMLK